MGPIGYSRNNHAWLPKLVQSGIIASALGGHHTSRGSHGREEDLLFLRQEEGGNKIVRVKDEHKGKGRLRISSSWQSKSQASSTAKMRGCGERGVYALSLYLFSADFVLDIVLAPLISFNHSTNSMS